MKTALLMIPSYKRPEVIDLTLKSFFALPEDKDWKITVAVADNKASPETQAVISKYPVNYLFHAENIGKAAALNDLLTRFDGPYDVLITCDNDMVFGLSWFWILDLFTASPFDFVGFAGPSWWWHLPLDRAVCPVDPDYKAVGVAVYRPAGIAGGLLAFRPDWLRQHPWDNRGGVYGLEDGLQCLETQNRGVFWWERDWICHDPLSSSLNAPVALQTYLARKRVLNEAGILVFKPGWDETDYVKPV
jgi:glycosyltransferase involved in cell wall biosynthesis